MALIVLVMAAMVAVTFFNTIIETVQDSISTMGLDRANTVSSKIMAYFCATVPYLWLANVLLILTTACAYLRYEVDRSKHSETQLRKEYKRQMTEIVLQTYRFLNQRDEYHQNYQNTLRDRNDYQQRYEDAAHANFDTQKRVAAMYCPRGKKFISTKSFGSHTCCKDGAKLQRRIVVLETELQNEIRFRKAPVDVGTISDIAVDMAQVPERWWPVLNNLLPSLMARVRAVASEHQSQDTSSQATIRLLSSEIRIQAATNEDLHMTIQEDAKKASDMQSQCATRQNLNTESNVTIRSLHSELEDKAPIIRALEDNKEAAEAATKSRGAEVEKIQCKSVVQAKSEQVETLTKKTETLNSLLSEREDANFDELDRQLHESNARVTELESRDVLTERLQNQCKDLQQQTATQSEEIERLIKDKSGLERKVKSKTVRFASSEIQPPSESASAETTLREEAKEKDARISELTQILHELQTAQNLADIEFGHCKAVITQAEQVARTALGPDSEVSSILELVQELGTRLERTKVEFAALEEFASIDPGVGNVIRSKILHLVGETHQLYEDKLASEFELQQVIGNSDDRIRQLMGQIGTVNNGGPELSNALAHISELERQNAEAATARHTAMGLQSQMNAQIIRQTQEIADLKRAERDLQRNLDKQVALMARLRSECDMFIDFLNTYKIGSESDSVAMRVGCLDTKYKGLKSTQGDFAKELQGTWNVLKKYHFTMKDTQGTPFPSVLDCVTTLVAQVAEAQSEVSRVFGFNGHYNPEVHNIARGVHELRKNRDTAVNFLNKDRATLEERNGELFNLRKQMKRLRNPQPHRQTEIASQESTMLHTESEAVPPGQLSGTKRGADEYDQMNSEGTERRPQLAGKKLRLAQGDEGDQEDQGKDIKMIQGERMEESS